MSLMVHHVWWIVPIWAHHVSAHATIFRSLALSPDLSVTVFYHDLLNDMVEKDLACYHRELVDRVNWIPCGASGSQVNSSRGSDLPSALISEFGRVAPTLKHPSKFVVDRFSSLELLPLIAELFPEAKTYMWWSPAATGLYATIAPAPDGAGDYREVADEHAQASAGGGRRGIISQVVNAKNGALQLNGTVVQVPGVGAMYDYEREQHNSAMPAGLIAIQASPVDLARAVDGILVASSRCIENAALGACQSLVNVVAVGLAVKPSSWMGDMQLDDGRIKAFLDTRAPKSVLFIPFGHVWFPASHVETVVETLLEIGQSFLFGGGPGGNDLPRSLIRKINASPDALWHEGFTDQVSILSHPSIGCMMHHGGWTSTSEALAAGVPVIIWPITRPDQPQTAALMSIGPVQLGYELLQIRLPPSRGRSMRGVEVPGTSEAIVAEVKDVMAKAFGQDGERVRRNIEMMRRALRAEHDTEAKEALLRFIETETE